MSFALNVWNLSKNAFDYLTVGMSNSLVSQHVGLICSMRKHEKINDEDIFTCIKIQTT